MYKLVGSIVCFYIPLLVMLITYCLTVRLLARQQQSLCGGGPVTGGVSTTNGNQPNGWGSGWLGQQNLGMCAFYQIHFRSFSVDFVFCSKKTRNWRTVFHHHKIQFIFICI